MLFKKQEFSAKNVISSHSYSSDWTAQHKHNLIIITITDERQSPIRVAPIAAIK